jgi:hypothetical protein
VMVLLPIAIGSLRERFGRWMPRQLRLDADDPW